MSIKELTLDDGEATLSVDYDDDVFGKDIIVLTMSNGGGFASLYCSKEDLKKFISNTKRFLDKIGEL